ncbi:unnamed protein product [Orchesella dallaii]
MFSMGLFLCITTSLIMITELSSFALLYQNRNLLIAIYDEKINTTDDTHSSLQTSSTSITENSTPMISTPEVVSESITSTISTITEATQESTSSLPVDTSSADNIDRTTETEYATTSASTDPPEDVKKRNPIIILEEHLMFVKTYLCYQSCLQPIINMARINASLSASTRSDNFITLTAQVATATDMRVAKRKVAHMALQYLFVDYLEESIVEPEWSIEIPNCEIPGNRTWTTCRKT